MASGQKIAVFANIKGCYDNIGHDWLLDTIPMDKAILKQFLKAGFVYNRHLNPTKVGTPQGGIISPILANMTLDGLEMAIASRFHVTKRGIIDKGRCNPHKVNFVRYADDFIVTAASEEKAKEIAVLVKDFLKERGLELSAEKTQISHIDDGFDFLGWNFRKYKGKLQIKPSKKAIDNVTRKISDVIKKAKAWNQENLIDALNPIIIGWSNYHRSVVSKEVFSKLDDRMWNMLWRWAKRRHPDKSRTWIIKKYWHSERNWVFSTERNRLKLFSDTKIVRHTSLKLDKNPYLEEKPRSGQPPKYTKRHKAEIIALACTKSPDGRKRWSLTLLTEELRKKEGFETINRESIRLILKKAKQNHG